MIQYAVGEAIAAGMTEMIFVTDRSQRAIKERFDKSYEIEAELETGGKVTGSQHQTEACGLLYVCQPNAIGLGHAMLCAGKLVDDKPLVVILADELLHGEPPVSQQMIEMFSRYQNSTI